MRHLTVLLLVAGVGAAGAALSKTPEPAGYQEAIELVHAFSGAGDELRRARQIAQDLARSHAGGGYAEVIQAEMLSTWNLNMAGGPPELLEHILALTDQALRLNPELALAHVARARALIRASRYEEGRQALDSALKLAPDLAGALFLHGEMHRRMRNVADAETWFLKFIERSPSATRKSNGHYWLAQAYEAAAWDHPRQWDAYVAKARQAHEQSIALDPGGAWKNVNFAIFLNNQGADFAAAERYARKALDIMDFEMARYHWAIAKYQKLLSMNMSDGALKLLAADIAKSTGVPLEEAAKFSEQYGSSYSPMRGRLGKIRQRLGGGGK